MIDWIEGVPLTRRKIECVDTLASEMARLIGLNPNLTDGTELMNRSRMGLLC